jgi:hypothetical protein
LSVPPAIASAPWVLLRAYEGSTTARRDVRAERNAARDHPDRRPTRGRLTGIAVQLPTLVRDEQGNEFPCRTRNGRCGTVWS